MRGGGGALRVEAVRRWTEGKLIPRPKNKDEGTHAPLLKKEDGRIDWNRPAQEIYNRMRGFDPWPGAYTSFRGPTCHLWAEPFSLRTLAGGAPGPIFTENGQILITCAHPTLFPLLSLTSQVRTPIPAAQ